MESNQDGAKPCRPAWIGALANRNFRLLWLGESVSLLGDQFYFVALPWLVFQITSSSLAFGTVLMVAGIPRALLMLVGGAATDRFSPRMVMLISNLLRLVITLILIGIVTGQTIQLWMLYGIAFCFGVVDAFFYPAYRAMIPVIMDEDQLQASNSLMLSTSQLVNIGGPGIAGMLVQAVGVALAFVFDAFTFLFTSIMLLLMRPTPVTPAVPHLEVEQTRAGILAAIREMLSFVRHHPALRTIILVIASVNFLFTGPLIVGSAALARVRFTEGAAAYGALLSAFGVGMLMGTLAAGVIRSRQTGLISLMLLAVQGLLLVAVGFTSTLVLACLLLVFVGITAGFGNVFVITLSQKLVTKDMMGRFMSLMVLAEVGLTPMSNALAGVLADWNVTALFFLAGGLLTLVSLLAARNPVLISLE
jgi:predicted MFS family arabinose efflux permease